MTYSNVVHSIKNIIPIELNALLTSNHYKLADLYDQYASVNTTANSTNITSRADLHRRQGEQGKAAILDLMWDSEKVAFYDFVSVSCYSALKKKQTFNFRSLVLCRTSLPTLEMTSSRSLPSSHTGSTSSLPRSRRTRSRPFRPLRDSTTL